MKYYFVVGERSGDLHASNLIIALQKLDPETAVRGMGGSLMQKAGADLYQSYEAVNFMGITDVVKNIFIIRKVFNTVCNDILEYKPDVIVLVDFAGFNLRLAKFAKKNNLLVFYYISPKVWAWNTRRAYKIKKTVDRLFCILPFEKKFYAKYGYEVDYVGNPILDAIATFTPNQNFLKQHFLAEKPIIALLPGSRKREIQDMLPIMLSVIPHFPQYEFVIAAVDTVLPQIEKIAPTVKCVTNATYDLLHNAEAALVTSGTATLETGLFKVPQVVCYKLGPISYALGKLLVKVRDIALVNLITDKIIVKTLLQSDLSTHNIRNELQKILKNGNYRNVVLDGYRQLALEMGLPGTSHRTAQLIIEYLHEHRTNSELR